MNYYSIPPLISSILFLILGIFVGLKNKKSIVNIVFAFTCFVTFWWQLNWFTLFNIKDSVIAYYLVKSGYTGIIFIPIAFFHFFVYFLIPHKIDKIIIRLSYSLGIILAIFLWSTNLFINGFYTYYFGFYPKAGFLHPVYLLMLFLLSTRAIYLLATAMIREKQVSAYKYNQIKYVLFSLIFYMPASSDFIVNYGFEFYPLGFISILISLIIFAYTVIRYRLMDVRLAITRTSIFVAVYTVVLGLPFLVAMRLRNQLIEIFGVRWWTVPLGLMAILATGGPFFYIYLQRRAEDRLLKEQRRYQNTLKHASIGMTRIHDLKRLLDLIVHIVTKTVRISYAAIYLYQGEANEYLLQASRDKGRVPIAKLAAGNPLVAWMQQGRDPLVQEEIKQKVRDTNGQMYKQLEEQMRTLDASVAVPSFLENRLLGFIVLGEKRTGQIYTPEDLSVFQILASQAALAIENAQFYEEAQVMQLQIAQAEKMATIGTMADGLSHQINNRFNALSMIAGDTIDMLKMTDISQWSSEAKEVITQINHALDRIQVNVIQGGAVVNGILKYTRKGEEGFESLSLDQILDGALGMLQYKIKLSEVDVLRNYPKDHPKIKGNLNQLIEVFFNFCDNGYGAIQERKETLKETGYRGKITISVNPASDGMLEVAIEDNGMGIKDENKKRVFTPFFTTKVSSRQGTGLGLYVIERIIKEFHKGKIWFESSHGKGTKFFIQLPTA